jgi:hypothetical protein
MKLTTGSDVGDILVALAIFLPILVLTAYAYVRSESG